MNRNIYWVVKMPFCIFFCHCVIYMMLITIVISHNTENTCTKHIMCNEPLIAGVFPECMPLNDYSSFALHAFLDRNTEALSPCSLMSCWVWYEQLDWTQSLVTHPGEWKPGCPIYPEVAASISLWPLTLIVLRLANLPVQRPKKIWKGKQRGLILWVMQLDSWSLVR